MGFKTSLHCLVHSLGGHTADVVPEAVCVDSPFAGCAVANLARLASEDIGRLSSRCRLQGEQLGAALGLSKGGDCCHVPPECHGASADTSKSFWQLHRLP